MATQDPLSVIIVGAGFGGLAAAIECVNRGMKVTIIEKYADSNSQGGESAVRFYGLEEYLIARQMIGSNTATDILDIFPNGGRVIKAWNKGKVGEEIHAFGCNKIYDMEIHKYDGKFISTVPWAINETERDLTYAGHRGKLHSIILDYARTLVPDLRIGVGVIAYLENDKKAGVTLSTGETLWADCVIAADGPRSIAREQVLGLFNEDETNTDSKWAVFRTFFKTDEASRAILKERGLFKEDRDTLRFWMCDNLTLLAFGNDGLDVAWALVHPDDRDSKEGWGNSNIADPDHLRKWMSYFTGTDAQTLLDITPERKSIDFKLVYRPPIDKWTSTGGQGASQAVEDAITVAYCLQNCERDVRLALEATQRIRFHRSNAVHKSGQANRDAFFKTPWEDIEADPDKFTRKRWPKLKIWDPLEFAEKQFPKVAKDIKDNVSGSPEELAIPVPDGGYWYGPGS
ncbi:unnamed protein product [Clonostachys rosea f. rosea IK726]|uniref:Uncharacterized protein n=1 Tax=Clonostachys rosea f. rosea IK726 TaxID=1349383 RepID=A0ACA9UDA9_BIOOC|nr:unnamed protein product [Clonostachys rosea f. rosea IK726]